MNIDTIVVKKTLVNGEEIIVKYSGNNNRIIIDLGETSYIGYIIRGIGSREAQLKHNLFHEKLLCDLHNNNCTSHKFLFVKNKNRILIQMINESTKTTFYDMVCYKNGVIC